MERRNGIKALSIVALLIAVAGLTVAFAAMSKTLTINGTASMDTAKWDIHFENLVISEPVGAASIVTAPTLQEEGTYIGDFEVSVTRPGDSIKFTFDVVNAGDIDAKYTDWLVNGIVDGKQISASQFGGITPEALAALYPSADWDGDGQTTQEERMKCINSGFIPQLTFNLSQNGILKSSDRITATFEIPFSRHAEELPKGEVTMSVNFELLFDQA